MRALTLVLLALGIVTVLGIVRYSSAQPTDPPRAAADKPIRWMFHRGGGIKAIIADAEVSRSLDNTRPIILKSTDETFVVPRSWNAVRVASFQSFREIKDALEQGTLVPGVDGILYDYERWPGTPEDEKRNPSGYVKQAADLVHARGLLFLTSPALNLVTVQAPGGKRDDATLFNTYLELGLAADAARYADIFDIQGQRGQHNTKLFADFVRRASAQARQANPKVVLLAGLSTNPLGRSVTADDLVRAVVATRDIVDGYWLNIPPNTKEYRPDIAIEVLRRLAKK